MFDEIKMGGQDFVYYCPDCDQKFYWYAPIKTCIFCHKSNIVIEHIENK